MSTQCTLLQLISWLLSIDLSTWYFSFSIFAVFLLHLLRVPDELPRAPEKRKSPEPTAERAAKDARDPQDSHGPRGCSRPRVPHNLSRAAGGRRGRDTSLTAPREIMSVPGVSRQEAYLLAPEQATTWHFVKHPWITSTEASSLWRKMLREN